LSEIVNQRYLKHSYNKATTLSPGVGKSFPCIKKAKNNEKTKCFAESVSSTSEKKAALALTTQIKKEKQRLTLISNTKVFDTQIKINLKTTRRWRKIISFIRGSWWINFNRFTRAHGWFNNQ
jgi:hypothetical protein